jgi:hypothetical protein
LNNSVKNAGLKRSWLETAYACLSTLGGVLLVWQGISWYLDKVGVPLVSILQGLVLLAAGQAILRQEPKAVLWVWVSAVMFGLGVLARGIIPVDLLTWFLIVAFAVWFTRKKRAQKIASSSGNPQT